MTASPTVTSAAATSATTVDPTPTLEEASTAALAAFAEYEAMLAFADGFHVYLYANLLVSTALGALLVYLIVWRSPNGMAVSQWLLANCALSSYLIVLAIAVWHPVPLPPPFAGFCVGPLRHTDAATSNLPFKVVVAMTYNCALCYFLGVSYQYVFTVRILGGVHKVAPSAALSGRSMRHVVGLMIFAAAYAACFSFIVVSVYFGIDGLTTSADEVRRSAEAAGGMFLVLLEREPTLTNYEVQTDADAAFTYTCVAVILLLGAFAVLMSVKFLQLLRQSTERSDVSLHGVTRNLQVQLYYTFLIKTGILLVTLCGGVALTFMLFLVNIEDYRLQWLGLISVATNAPLSYVHTILFFRPYRRYVQNLLGRAISRVVSSPTSRLFKTTLGSTSDWQKMSR